MHGEPLMRCSRLGRGGLAQQLWPVQNTPGQGAGPSNSKIPSTHPEGVGATPPAGKGKFLPPDASAGFLDSLVRTRLMQVAGKGVATTGTFTTSQALPAPNRFDPTSARPSLMAR